MTGTDSSEARSWLAHVLGGASPSWPFESGELVTSLVETAHDEGVVAMIDWRLRSTDAAVGDKMPVSLVSPVPLALRNAFESAARIAALQSMVFQGETVTVLETMAAAGIPGLLLKGTALAHWLYPRPHWRASNDVDVLLPSRDAAEALAAGLQRRGYERLKTSGELVAYELMCRRAVTDELKAEIDVHWALSNSVLFANVFSFDELMAGSIAVPALGANARALGPVHACVHACVHRVRNLTNGVPDRLKWLYDIVLLVEQFDTDDWSGLVALARDKRLAGVVVVGLEAAAAVFGRTLPQHVLVALRDAQERDTFDATRIADWRYMQRVTFDCLPNVGLRVRWLWQRAFPSRAYMGYLYGAADRSYLALVGLRLRRLVMRLNRGKAPSSPNSQPR